MLLECIGNGNIAIKLRNSIKIETSICKNVILKDNKNTYLQMIKENLKLDKDMKYFADFYTERLNSNNEGEMLWNLKKH